MHIEGRMYRTSTFLLCLYAVFGNAPTPAFSVAVGEGVGAGGRGTPLPYLQQQKPRVGLRASRTPRFVSVKDRSHQAAALQGMKDMCSCKFADTTTETEPIGGRNAKCAPKAAICGFCMNAAYAAYWNPDQDTCAQYMNEARDVCKKVAEGAQHAGPELGKLYQAYGPEFGASSVWCKSQSCCPNREVMGFPVEKLDSGENEEQ